MRLQTPSFATSTTLPHRLRLPQKYTCSRRLRCPRYHHNSPISLSAPSKPQVVIVGGGAAGFFAGITLARITGESTTVTILEGSPAVLSKVRISGGGRCNVTSGLDHHDSLAFAANYPRGSRAMPAILSRFGPADVVRFFEEEGVALKVEATGKIFPVSDSSDTVIDALVAAAARAGIAVHTRVRVVDIRQDGAFQVLTASGHTRRADFVLVATGSAPAAQRWAARLGHAVIAPVPSLFTFRVDDARLRELAGVSVPDCRVSLQVPKVNKDGSKKRGRSKGNDGLVQRGPLLITHWGLSGPAILTLSAFGARILNEEKYKLTCAVDWLPELTLEEKVSWLRTAKLSLGMKNIATVSPFKGKFPNRMWRYLLESIPGLLVSQKWSSLRNEHMNKLADKLHCSKFLVKGKGQFKDEFVTAGGVALNNIHSKTFESKHCPGLYFAGEALDVDGRTGGYNLEFAWSSGYIVGASIGDKVLQMERERVAT